MLKQQISSLNTQSYILIKVIFGITKLYIYMRNGIPNDSLPTANRYVLTVIGTDRFYNRKYSVTVVEIRLQF